ncbi:MAG: SpoIIE family protein phosphatase [Bacteroidia bacterium]|nr:SpoIIE family protein phosphatase [Bacteroidia bacterium]
MSKNILGYLTNYLQRFAVFILLNLCICSVSIFAQLSTVELPEVSSKYDLDEGADVVADWCYAMLDSAANAYMESDIRSAEYWCAQAQKAIKDSTSYYYHRSLLESVNIMKGYCPESNQQILNAVNYLEKVGSYRASKGLIMALCAAGHFEMYYARPRAVQIFKRLGDVAQTVNDNSKYVFSLILQSQAFSMCAMLPHAAQKAREALRLCENEASLDVERFYAQCCLAVIYSQLKSSEMASRYFKQMEDERVYQRNYYLNIIFLLHKCDHMLTIRDYQRALFYSDQSLHLRELVATDVYDWCTYLQRCKLATLLLREEESDGYANKCDKLMGVASQFDNDPRYSKYCLSLVRSHNYVLRGENNRALALLDAIPQEHALMYSPDFADAYYAAYERAYIGNKNYRKASYILNQHAILSSLVAKAHAKAREEDMLSMYKTDPTIIKQQSEISQQVEDTVKARYQSTFWMLFSIILIVIALIAFSYNRRRAQRADARKAMELRTRLMEEVESQTLELRRQNELISLHNADILRSQTYAKRIQQGLLPTEEKLVQPGWFSSALIIFKPLEITSGDFYWYSKIDNRIILCAGDAARHGVPGAMISMVALTVINDVVHRRGSEDTAASMLNEMYERMMDMMPKFNEHNDVAITVAIYDVKSQGFNVASATQSVIYTNGDDVIPIYETRRTDARGRTSFRDEFCQLAQGDSFFFYTDGLTSMLNGETQNRLQMSGVVNIIEKSLAGSITDKYEFIRQELNNWKGSSVQSDDVLLLGITI